MASDAVHGHVTGGRPQVADVVVLGAGVCGMAAASVLGDRAVVVEREDRPGGLVRTTEGPEGYWFDHVLHLLHFFDGRSEQRVRTLLGDAVLAPCPPEAWVDCEAGTVRYPFQHHLGGLRPDVVAACLSDFAGASGGNGEPSNYEALLLWTFGATMCEQFFFPYNRKVWRRPLRELAPAGFQWNLARPTLDELLAGAHRPETSVSAYNSNAWYPRPGADAPWRGMEVVSRALTARVADLRLGHTVDAIDLDRRLVRLRRGREVTELRFVDACLSTMPLPAAINCCVQADAGLRRRCESLTYNRVRSVALALRGPRPERPGLWRYYTDESVLFTRLVHLVEFDPMLAPVDGWALLAEVTERGEDAPAAAHDLVRRVVADARRIGAVGAGSTLRGARVFDADPAYVVFTPENACVIDAARSFLLDHGVTPLGRYGRWEYSSMAQVMTDGFRWADAIASVPEAIG